MPEDAPIAEYYRERESAAHCAGIAREYHDSGSYVATHNRGFAESLCAYLTERCHPFTFTAEMRAPGEFLYTVIVYGGDFPPPM